MTPNQPQPLSPMERKPELEIGLAKKDDRLVGCYCSNCKEDAVAYFGAGPFLIVLCMKHLTQLAENIQKALAPHTAA